MAGSIPSASNVPPGSVAAMVRALAASTQPTTAFRDAACASLRLTRERGRIECDALGVLFEDEQTTDDRRSLILDLLAHAGTPEAQLVMRRLLSLGIARRDSRTFASFVQRLGFMERPDGATLRFLISVYAESKREAHEVRAACAYALGSGAGRAYVWGLTDAAMRASEVLRHDLLNATTPAEKCALVTALGNAALESDVSVILRFASDPEPRVRSSSVLALKKMHTSEARGSLLTLLSMSDQSVAESALSALFEQTLGHEEIVRLAELVLAGRTPLSLDSRILRLVVTQKLHVVGQVSLDTVEDAINLLLSRIESQALREGATPQILVPSRSRYVRPFVSKSTPPASAEPTRSRMMPIPKTPLPYSAGYSMVSHTESTHVADSLEEVPRAATVEQPPPPLVPALTRQTLSYGSIGEALRVATAQADALRAAAAEVVDNFAENLDEGWDTPADEAEHSPTPSFVAPAMPSAKPKLESEIRTLSAVNVPVPIVPLAIIR